MSQLQTPVAKAKLRASVKLTPLSQPEQRPSRACGRPAGRISKTLRLKFTCHGTCSGATVVQRSVPSSRSEVWFRSRQESASFFRQLPVALWNPPSASQYQDPVGLAEDWATYSIMTFLILLRLLVFSSLRLSLFFFLLCCKNASKLYCFKSFASILIIWGNLAGPRVPLAGPRVPLAGPRVPLAGPGSAGRQRGAEKKCKCTSCGGGAGASGRDVAQTGPAEHIVGMQIRLEV